MLFIISAIFIWMPIFVNPIQPTDRTLLVYLIAACVCEIILMILFLLAFEIKSKIENILVIEF